MRHRTDTNGCLAYEVWLGGISQYPLEAPKLGVVNRGYTSWLCEKGEPVAGLLAAMTRPSGLLSVGALVKAFALSVVMTLTLASAALAGNVGVSANLPATDSWTLTKTFYSNNTTCATTPAPSSQQVPLTGSATNTTATSNKDSVSLQAPAASNGGQRFFSGWTGPNGFTSTAGTICVGGFSGNTTRAYVANYVPAVRIDDVTITEGASGTTNATFSVSLSATSSQQVTVNCATADDTATQTGDYVATSGTLTFASGETTKPVTVVVNGDTTDEADERFYVNLSNATNATIADNQGVGTITDDDYTPQANDNGSAGNPITLVEDDLNGVTADVLANDTGLGDTPITVQVTTPPGKGTTTVNGNNTVTYTPGANQNGPDTYIYRVTDSDGQTSTATVYLQITPINDAPNIGSVINDGPVGESSPATITVAATDVEGDTLSHAFDCNNDSNFKIGPQPGNTAQCTFSDDGTRRVNVRVTDGNGGTVTGSTDVTVNNVAPNAGDDTSNADEDGADVVVDVLANDTDVSGDSLTITDNTQPPAG
jgi:hypothetical protein